MRALRAEVRDHHGRWEARTRMQSEVSAMRRAIPVERACSRDFGR